MLKMGIYGLIRLMIFVDLFFVIFSLFGFFFISLLICFFSDFKIIIANSSIIYINIKIVGLFMIKKISCLGSYVLSLNHSFSSIGLFVFLGFLFKFGNRNIYIIKGILVFNLYLYIFYLYVVILNLSFPYRLGFFGELIIIYQICRFLI
jgi:NADH:ubiquinone oxidoreductase subunit 4 (subunit M)